MAVSVVWNSPAICEAPHVSVIVTMDRVSGLRGHVMQAGRRLYRGGAVHSVHRQAGGCIGAARCAVYSASWHKLANKPDVHAWFCMSHLSSGSVFSRLPGNLYSSKASWGLNASRRATRKPVRRGALANSTSSSTRATRQQQPSPAAIRAWRLSVFGESIFAFLSSRETRSRERRRYAKHCPGG